MTDELTPAATSTEQRLDAILAELRGLRADLTDAPVRVRQRVDRLTDDLNTVRMNGPVKVELREPERLPVGEDGPERLTEPPKKPRGKRR